VTGVLFTPQPYRPHVAHIIKQTAETRNASPLAVTDDGELYAPLRPSTIYTVRIVLVQTAAGALSASAVWRPACTSSLDYCALAYHRQVVDNPGTEFWNTASTGDHQGHLYDTAAFNAVTNFNFAQGAAHRCTGVIQTSSSGGSFSIQWGGGNGSRTIEDGSFMFLQEARAY